MTDSPWFWAITSILFGIVMSAAIVIDNNNLLSPKYEQRFQIVYCDDREPINIFIISRFIIDQNSIVTEVREKVARKKYKTFAIPPMIQVYDLNTNINYKFINVCEVNQLQPPKIVKQ